MRSWIKRCLKSLGICGKVIISSISSLGGGGQMSGIKISSISNKSLKEDSGKKSKGSKNGNLWESNY